MLHENGASAGIEKGKPAVVATDEGGAQRHHGPVARQQSLVEMEIAPRILDETTMSMHDALRNRSRSRRKDDHCWIVLSRTGQRNIGSILVEVAGKGRSGGDRAAALGRHRR